MRVFGFSIEQIPFMAKLFYAGIFVGLMIFGLLSIKKKLKETDVQKKISKKPLN